MHFFEQSLQCSMSEPISTTSASSTCQWASRLERTLTRSDLASAQRAGHADMRMGRAWPGAAHSRRRHLPSRSLSCAGGVEVPCER